MGACGVTCSVFEMAAAGGVSLDVYLDDIPTREEGMTPQEILLSESRFMFLIEADKVDAALEHFRYGVQAAVCGEVASHDRVKIRFKEELFVDLPAELVADGCPPSDWPVADAIPQQDGYPEFEMPTSLNDVLRGTSQPPGLVNQGRALFTLRPDRRQSHSPWTNSRAKHPCSSYRIQSGASRSLFPAAATSAPMTHFLVHRQRLQNPARNLACTGAMPIAITDGLNIASPRDPVENKLEQVIAGLKAGLEA